MSLKMLTVAAGTLAAATVFGASQADARSSVSVRIGPGGFALNIYKHPKRYYGYAPYYAPSYYYPPTDYGYYGYAPRYYGYGSGRTRQHRFIYESGN